MAFQAQSKGRRTVQQAWIGAAVRVVAGLAALDSDGRVLVHKGTALVGMALRAGNVIPETVRNHARKVRRAPGRERGSVWIVAIRAVHGPLVDTVLERHVEARFYLPMAAVADAPLLGHKQRTRLVGAVDRMAARATDFPGQVRRPANMHLADVLAVAAKANILGLARFDLGKLHDLPVIRVNDVEAGRAMASLAAGPPCGPVRQGHRLEVRIAGKVLPHGRMAVLADPAAQELLAGWPVLFVERTQDVAVRRPLALPEGYEGGNKGRQNDGGRGRGDAGQAGPNALSKVIPAIQQ